MLYIYNIFDISIAINKLIDLIETSYQNGARANTCQPTIIYELLILYNKDICMAITNIRILNLNSIVFQKLFLLNRAFSAL